MCSDFEAQENKVSRSISMEMETISIVSSSICHEVMGPDAMILVFWMLSLSQLFHSPPSPCGSDSKASCLQSGRPSFNPWVGKILWRRKWPPTPVLLPGKSHGRKSLVGYSPWGLKESDTTERLHFTSFTFIKRLFSSSFSAIRVVSFAYLRL